MSHRTLVLQFLFTLVQPPAATAQDAHPTRDSAIDRQSVAHPRADSMPRFWRIGATENAADVVLEFNPRGTLYFRGGFKWWSPAKWSYEAGAKRLTLTIPKFRKRDLPGFSATLHPGEYLRFDPAKKALILAFTPDTSRIALFGYYFFPEYATSELYLIQFYNTEQWCAYRTRAAWEATKDSLLGSETSSAETIGTVSFQRGALSRIALDEFDDPGAGDWFVQDTYSVALDGKLSSVHRLQNVLPDDYS